jgi:hypothetical protein
VSGHAEQFLEVYRQARVEDQRLYYERSARRSQAAHRQLLLTSAVVFGISATAGLIAGLDVRGNLVWAILAAVLPAVTTVLSAYEGLYAFERIAKLYRDAARNLRRAEPPNISGAGDQRTALTRYVAEVEQVLTAERGQWGQLAVEPPPDHGKT